MEPVVKVSAGLDVHRKNVVATILSEQDDGSLQEKTCEFGTFLKNRKQLRRWLLKHNVELIVMESTGIYWKAIYSILERMGLNIYVVNARHAKNLPGRKTDVQDSKWLATLARFGLLRPNFIPPEDLRELRLMIRRRMKMQGILSGEKNCLHKILDDSGIRLGAVVSDINGVSAQAIIDGLIRGELPGQLMQYIHGRLKARYPNCLNLLKGLFAGLITYLLIAIYCAKKHGERVNI